MEHTPHKSEVLAEREKIRREEQQKQGKSEWDKNQFEKEIFALINSYTKQGLSKPELVAAMEYVTQSCKMS